jgi:beta-phosphoglucomutase family hydrolase
MWLIMKDLPFDAVIFDLDGVITNTASVHSKAWKAMFDGYLKYREEHYEEAFQEFTHEKDYLPYVDGKPRYKGVQSFLESRGIHIPFGDPSDTPDDESVCGLGNKKNHFFNEIIKRDGVDVYQTTIRFIKTLKQLGIKIGVASSSKNCKPVLEAANLLHLFETRVDGVVSAKLGLKGKPEADIFTTACDNVNVSYYRAIIVEDAVSGVQAGANGNFGLTLGVAREENEQELLKNGADIVVTDLGEISIEDIVDWFNIGLKEDEWSLVYRDYDPKKEKTREALLTVGNGYFATRGAMEETIATDINYPGTYIAGLYNKVESEVAGRIVTNEDFVNCPNWLLVKFKISSDWININNCTIEQIERKLSFKTGLLEKKTANN